MDRSIWRIFSLAAVFATVSACQLVAVPVNYSGTIYDLFSGAPVQGGRVIVGTFKPGFNVGSYACTYGDSVCNVDPNNYSEAVADGNFIPLNSGVLTNSSGFFSGSGDSNSLGSQLYIFAFHGSQPDASDLQEALATGPSSSFSVNFFTNIDASQANQFIFGSHFSSGIRLGGLPFPEPSCCVLAGLIVVLMTGFCVRRRSVA